MKRIAIFLSIILAITLNQTICIAQNTRTFSKDNFSFKYPSKYQVESEDISNFGIRMTMVNVSSLDDDYLAEYAVTYTSNPIQYLYKDHEQIMMLKTRATDALDGFKESEGITNTKHTGPFETTFKNKRAAKITFSSQILIYTVYGEIISFFDKGHLVVIMKMTDNKSNLSSGDFLFIDNSITFK